MNTWVRDSAGVYLNRTSLAWPGNNKAINMGQIWSLSIPVYSISSQFLFEFNIQQYEDTGNLLFELDIIDVNGINIDLADILGSNELLLPEFRVYS